MRAIIHFDGGVRPTNPGLGSYGYTIEYNNNKWSGQNLIGRTTNNIAEYSGLISALRRCISLGIKEVYILGDSQLIIKQITGKYRTKNRNMQILCKLTKKLLKNFDKWEAKWIKREINEQADLLAESIRFKN